MYYGLIHKYYVHHCSLQDYMCLQHKLIENNVTVSLKIHIFSTHYVSEMYGNPRNDWLRSGRGGINIHSVSTKFRTGIIKSICVKEITLLLFSFRHTSLLTGHTDLHGHTASRCLCRSRPLQWCLMYFSRLSGCLKSSKRDTPSSGISLLGTKSNQQVLNLANTEGGWAQ